MMPITVFSLARESAMGRRYGFKSYRQGRIYGGREQPPPPSSGWQSPTPSWKGEREREEREKEKEAPKMH